MRGWKAAVIGALVGGVILTGTAHGAGTKPGARVRRARVPSRQAAKPKVKAPAFDPTCVAVAPPEPPRPAPWLRVGGLKQRGPKLNRSEAGITLALSEHLALQVHYERTAHAPMMHDDHDDGILTRLRLTF